MLVLSFIPNPLLFSLPEQCCQLIILYLERVVENRSYLKSGFTTGSDRSRTGITRFRTLLLTSRAATVQLEGLMPQQLVSLILWLTSQTRCFLQEVISESYSSGFSWCGRLQKRNVQKVYTLTKPGRSCHAKCAAAVCVYFVFVLPYTPPHTWVFACGVCRVCIQMCVCPQPHAGTLPRPACESVCFPVHTNHWDTQPVVLLV